MRPVSRRAVLAGVPALLLAACAPAPPPTPAATAPAVSRPASLFVMNKTSPHVVKIDATTNKAVQTKDIPDFKSWGWNDDNNFYDGKHLWLTMHGPAEDDGQVFLLDLDTLEITQRIALGKEKMWLYLGKPSTRGIILVSKHVSGQVATIDTKTYKVLEIKDVPVNGGFACDMDIGTGPDGVERGFVPTWPGDTVFNVDTGSRQVLQTLSVPKGTNPTMLTVSRDGRYVWVQEAGTSTNAILDPKTLEVVKRIPTGKAPVINTFSPDGKLSYITHGADTKVMVVDATTFEVVKNVEVGANPTEVAVHPNGKLIYAIVTKENAVAVIDTTTWQVTQRIDLGVTPDSIFFRPIA